MRFIAALLLSSLCASAADTWLADLDVARKQAAAEGKDILVAFTACDWCGECVRMDKEVFASQGFLAKAPKAFVLVRIELPMQGVLSAEQKAKNEALALRWGVSLHPTVVLADAAGVPYGLITHDQYDGGGFTKFPDLDVLRRGNTPEARRLLGQRMEETSIQMRNEQLWDAAMSQAFEDSDYDAAAAVIDQRFAGASGDRLAIACFKKAELSVRFDSDNKERALSLMDEGLRHATGDPALRRALSITRFIYKVFGFLYVP